MRLIILALIQFCLFTGSYCQVTKPVILQGQFKNSPVKELTVFIQNIPGIYEHDTLRLFDDGTFYLRTYKITEPQEIAIQGNGFYLNTLYVAPGFDLTLKSDGKDWKSTRKTLQIEGIGKESNAFLMGSNYNEYPLNPQEPIERKFLKQFNQFYSFDDSVYQVHYVENISNKPYFDYFSEVIRLDIQFDKLVQLIQYILLQSQSPKEIERFVRNNFDNKVLDNFSNDDWLISKSYRSLTAPFFRYKMIVEGKYDELNKGDEFLFENLRLLYSGQTLEYVLSNSIRARYFRSKDLNELESKVTTFEPYIRAFQNKKYVTYLEKRYQSKKQELIRAQVGKPAPQFSLPDSTGVLHSLIDFQGKVVFLDLWASWCGPCRKETPILKDIYQEFQSNKDIVFIGIAIRDTEENWIKAMNKDQPIGLQLIDVDQVVSKTYHANILPRYIVIDKNGNYADSDAPRPSERIQLVDILNAEISRDY